MWGSDTFASGCDLAGGCELDELSDVIEFSENLEYGRDLAGGCELVEASLSPQS